MKFICFLIESVCLFCIEFFEYFYCRDGDYVLLNIFARNVHKKLWWGVLECRSGVKYFCRRMRQKIMACGCKISRLFSPIFNIKNYGGVTPSHTSHPMLKKVKGGAYLHPVPPSTINAKAQYLHYYTIKRA